MMGSPGTFCLGRASCCSGERRQPVQFEQVPESPSFTEVDMAAPYPHASCGGAVGSSAGCQLLEVLLELQRCIEPALSALREDKGQFASAATSSASLATAPVIREEPRRSHERTPYVGSSVPAPDGVVAPPAAGEACSRSPEVKFEVPLQDETQPKDSDADSPTPFSPKATSAATSARSCPLRGEPSQWDGSMASGVSEATTRRPMGRAQGAGRASVGSVLYSAPTRINAPMRALVINVRKLVDAQEKLHMLHVLINSTAIAAITLANAGSEEQFRCTVWFGICAMVTFVLHESHWDLLEISDFRLLLPMLSDDGDGGRINPNRLLKAMSVSEWRFSGFIYAVVHTAGLFVGTFAWLMVVNWWEFTAGRRRDTNTLVDRWRAWFVATEEDGLVLGMQVSVGTLMFLLHFFFEAYHYQETCAVMPRTHQNGIWDPRIDGVPLRFRLFGLPGLWFTSKEALEDFTFWVNNANATRSVAKIYPQEMAFYALCGSPERQEVQLALKYSKLFDGQKREFVDRHGRGSEEELDIELTFFDEALKNKECRFPGEFLSIVDNDEDELRCMEALEAAGSQDIPSLPPNNWKNRQVLGMMRFR